MNLINKIDDFLIKRDKKERNSYYPSEVSRCLRQLWYKWKMVKESNPINPGGYWKMRMGDKIHDLIFEFLEQAGLEIINEISFKYDAGLKYPISGRIDNIFIDEDGVMSGIEIKSSFGAGIRNLKKIGPRKYDLEQIIMYMGCTDIKRFYLIYIARDDGYRTQYVIEQKQVFNDFSENAFVYLCNKVNINIYFDELINKFKKLEKMIDNNVLPNREHKSVIKNGELKNKIQKNKFIYKSDWQCFGLSSRCQYANHCWKEIIDKSKNKIYIGEDEL